MREQVVTADRAVAEIARRQHGVVSYAQLCRAGLDASAMTRRVEASRLHRIHRGVYAVGHLALSREGRWMAAVLACGEGAVVSHRSAAVLWGLLRPKSELVHISVRRLGGKAGRRGIRLHRSRTLAAAATTSRHGIPVTKPARTIEDLRRCCPEKELLRAKRQAAVLGLPLGPGAAPRRTRSDLEDDFLALCRRHGLPTPEVNVKIEGREADFLWRDADLIVEADSYLYHRGEVAFQDDHSRNLHFRLAGYEVIRLSEEQVDAEPTAIAKALRKRLSPAS